LSIEEGLDRRGATEIRQTSPLPHEEADRLNHNMILTSLEGNG
jgi:hypothetical protein